MYYIYYMYRTYPYHLLQRIKSDSLGLWSSLLRVHRVHPLVRGFFERCGRCFTKCFDRWWNGNSFANEARAKMMIER